MIGSWKDFFTAVEKMRRSQKEYFRTRSQPSFSEAKRREMEVDACIEKKRAEWARQLRPETE